MPVKEQTFTVVELLDNHPTNGDMQAEILASLALYPKQLPPKYFYDLAGSRLFDRITELPEYYPTRTEQAIMEANIDEIAKLIGPRASLIEFGSGSSTKVRLILDHLSETAAYVPVEISREHLLAAAQDIALDYPQIEVLPVCADFTQPFRLPFPAVRPETNVVFFPGSTIGNFYPDEALSLLKQMSRVACSGGDLLIGVDLKKDPAILELAYNDAAGVTAEFNLNVLKRINRDLGANFDVAAFEHRAIYNEDMSRIEMHLISRRDQHVDIGKTRIEFAEGEYILTECSHKYSVNEFAALAAKADLEPMKVWTDAKNLFSVHLMRSNASNESCTELS